MKKIALIAAICLVQAAVATANPTAFRIDSTNIAQLSRNGPSAIAGLGDWWLTNGHICVAVSGLKHDAGIVAGGGSLVDISHCGRNNDQWLNNNILAGMAKDDALQAQVITVENDGDSASILVTGEKDGIIQTVRYSLAVKSSRLRMEIMQRRVGDGPKMGMSAVLTLHPSGSLSPFSFSADADDGGLGFRLGEVDNNSILAMLKAMTAADTAYLLGNDNESAPMSYRLRLADATLTTRSGEKKSLPIFQLIVADYTMFGWMTRPTWIGGGYPGLLMFSQMPLMDLRRGEKLSAVFEIDVVGTTDVAGFPPLEAEAMAQLSGTTTPGSAIAVYRKGGEAISQLTADSDGNFTLAVPDAVAYQLDINTPDGQYSRTPVSATPPLTHVDAVFPEPGILTLPAGEIMQLTFTGIDGTPDPVFRAARSMLRNGDNFEPGSSRSRDLVLSGSDDDLQQVALPPGNYRVLASRGIDFGVSETVVAIEPGTTTALELAAPVRQVLQTGTVSADFHVHSSVSFDSTVTRRDQLKRFVAAGGDVLVFTEHNRIAELTPATDLPLQLINGLEYTGTARTAEAPTTIGHSNAFPVTFDAAAHRGGTPRVEGSTLREVMSRTRTRWPQSLLQLNHPRSPHPNDADLAFFSHLSRGVSFDPLAPLTEGNNALLLEVGADGTRDIDFDLIEVLNGSEIDVYEAVKGDWFALLAAGYKKVGTANSDSHAWKTPLGIPVNRIMLDSPVLPVDEVKLTGAIRAGKMYGTSGPALSVALVKDNGKQRWLPGDTCECSDAELQVTVATADWVGADTLVVYVGGKPVHTRTIDGAGSSTLSLDFSRDTFVVVEVKGVAGEIYETIYPGYQPIAFSNPVYIDADGNGTWTPQ